MRYTYITDGQSMLLIVITILIGYYLFFLELQGGDVQLFTHHMGNTVIH